MWSIRLICLFHSDNPRMGRGRYNLGFGGFCCQLSSGRLLFVGIAHQAIPTRFIDVDLRSRSWPHIVGFFSAIHRSAIQSMALAILFYMAEHIRL